MNRRPALTHELSLDGQALAGETIPLLDDHTEHFVEMQVR